MKKPTKILLAIATAWPVFYMVLFFAFVLSAVFLADGSEEGGPIASMFLIIFPLHILTMLLIMGLTVFYIVNVFRNERVDKDKKALWAIVLFMGSMIAFPIYWYLYIWREVPPVSQNPPQSLNAAADASRVSNAASNQRDAEYVPPSQPPDWR